jgi:hypothetical protein
MPHMAIVLYDKAQNRKLFEITAAQRDQLVGALEEESTKDRDYYVDANVIDFLGGKVDEAVLAKLRTLVGGGVAAPPDVEVDADMDDIPEVAGGEEPAGLEIEWREE